MLKITTELLKGILNSNMDEEATNYQLADSNQFEKVLFSNFKILTFLYSNSEILN